MATESVKTIKTSGGDYTSLSGWEGGEQGDLTGVRDEIAVAECYSFEDTTSFTIDGWTTSGTQYPELRTPSAERHDGKWNTSKYRLVDTQGFTYIIVCNEDNVRIKGIQIYNQNTAGGGGIHFNGGAGEVHLSHNIIRTEGTTSRPIVNLSTVGGSATVKIWNNVIYDGFRGIYHEFGNAGNTYVIYNNTVHDVTGVGINIDDSVGDVSLYLKNNIVQGAVTNYSVASFTTLSTADNVSEDATSPNAPHRNDAVTFENEGADDFHLGSGDTNAIDLGTDLSTDSDGQLSFSDDIDGETRSGTWDIGADEYVAAASGNAGALLNGGLMDGKLNHRLIG